MITAADAVIIILLLILAGVFANWKVLWLQIQTIIEDFRQGR